MMKAVLLSTFFFSCCLFAVSQDTISRADIITAGRVVGLTFKESEADSMLRDVRTNRNDYNNLRKYPLNNSTPITLAHSPLLPGMKFGSRQLPVAWAIPANVSVPANKNGLAFYSVLQLASLIKSKKISSVELTRFFLDRLHKYADTLECVISYTQDIAMEQARQADKEIAAGKYRGPLHGIPYGLKDLFSVKGTKTTWGAEPYKNQVLDEDAFVYSQLKKAGAVLVAKFTLGALAMGDYWYGGRTKTPWDLTRGSSGSSAGSAAATVAGLVPFAIGTETWGSIISPSTACGATGLRPTFGSISRSGAMALSWSLDKIGPICRNAEDAAIVFNYIHGTDSLDASAVNRPFNYSGKADWKKLKIGYAKNYFDKITDTSSPDLKVLEVYRKLGANLQPVVFPDSAVYNMDIMGIVIGGESAALFDEFTRTEVDDMMTRQTRSDWPNSFRISRLIPAVEYLNANRHRYLLMKAVHQLFKDYDVIICPTWGGNQSAITNLTGHPAVCFPTGFNRIKLPTSITLLGKLYGDAAILSAAKAYQDATSWDEMHPELFR
ncbi:amidase [Segetibacter sp. 3557_3]|uniref:amidase n=1 Tax=Segetibacter sp. 3557_3 TaxID=2547429 RepID=UPI001A9DBD4E|nr:amidase [Segetibacter sp. 3557_3]